MMDHHPGQDSEQQVGSTKVNVERRWRISTILAVGVLALAFFARWHWHEAHPVQGVGWALEPSCGPGPNAGKPPCVPEREPVATVKNTCETSGANSACITGATGAVTIIYDGESRDTQ